MPALISFKTSSHYVLYFVSIVVFFYFVLGLSPIVILQYTIVVVLLLSLSFEKVILCYSEFCQAVAVTTTFSTGYGPSYCLNSD